MASGQWSVAGKATKTATRRLPFLLSTGHWPLATGHYYVQLCEMTENEPSPLEPRNKVLPVAVAPPASFQTVAPLAKSCTVPADRTQTFEVIDPPAAIVLVA